MTDLDLIEAYVCRGDGGYDAVVDAIDRLRGLLAKPAANVWPHDTFEAALEVFGGPVNNPASRTFKALDRRIQHALRCWRETHGPLNAEQENYGDAVMASCIFRAETLAAGDTRKLYPLAQEFITRAIRDDRVVAGFARRAGLRDVSSMLAEALA